MASTNEEILIKLKALDELTPVMLKALQSMEESSSKMSQALDDVGKASVKTQEQTENLHGGVISLAAGFTLVKEAVEVVHAAFEKVEQFFEKAIEESLEAEKAFNRMQGALISTGKYTKDLSEELREYAEATQEATGASAETIQNIIAQGVQMGLSVEKAQELEEATRKLAAATGDTLEGAFSTMQASLAGQTRGLGKVLPQIKELGTAQLKAGEQIDIVNKALNAQYELYVGSFAGGLAQAKSGVNDVYKEIGKMITQNPIVIAGLEAFNEIIFGIAHSLEDANKWLKAHQSLMTEIVQVVKIATVVTGVLVAGWVLMGTVIPFVTAVMGALATSVSLYGVAGTIAANATALLDAALAILAAPITLVILAVVALTAAFYKWPGLFDILIGGIKALIGIALLPLTGALGALAIGIGAIVGVFKKDWGAALDSAGKKMIELNASLVTGGIEQVKFGAASIAAGKSAKEGGEAAAKAMEEANVAASKAAAAAANLQKTYDGFKVGTMKQRQELEAQVSQRNEDLKQFTNYLDNKKRLAISYAQEQEAEVNKVRADALKGAGGGESKSADAQVALDAETAKQAQLKVIRDKGLIDIDQYNEAAMASNMRSQQAQLQMDTAFATARAEALGDGPASFTERMALKKQQFDQELALSKQKAEEAGATSDQIRQMELDKTNNFYQQQLEMTKVNRDQEIMEANAHTLALADALGTSEAGFQLKQQAAEQQFQIELQARLQRASQEGATDDQIMQLRESALSDNLERRKQLKLRYIEDDMKKNEMLGNNWQVTLDKMRLAQEKDGKLLGTIRGVQQTQEFKGTQDFLSNVSSLRSSKSKEAFEIGKKAAIAQATVNTFLAATEAYASLAAIPIVGPILGAVAAAAAVAAGFVQIQNINSQQFSQAHGGIDDIPDNMSNKTFLLNGGERVVQPEANKKLTAFLDSQDQKGKDGGPSGGGPVYNITLNYGGNGSQEDARKMAEMVVDQIRQMSERGQPIMSDKGIVKS